MPRSFPGMAGLSLKLPYTGEISAAFGVTDRMRSSGTSGPWVAQGGPRRELKRCPDQATEGGVARCPFFFTGESSWARPGRPCPPIRQIPLGQSKLARVVHLGIGASTRSWPPSS
jgi:hypothetical protein